MANSKTTATSIRFDTTIYNRLNKIAQNENRSFGNLVNHICDRYIMFVKEEKPELLIAKSLKDEADKERK